MSLLSVLGNNPVSAILIGLIAASVSIALLASLWRRGNATTRSFRERIGAVVLGLPPCLLLWLWCFQIWRPERVGPLALLQVFAPYLALPVLVLLPIALLGRMRVAFFSLLVCALLGAIRFIPVHTTGVPVVVPHARRISVMTWNVAAGSRASDQAERVRPVLSKKPADVIALEEADWRWVEDDSVLARLYPYRAIHTRKVPRNLVLLSRFPVLAQGGGDVPPGVRGWQRILWARLDLGGGQQLMVVVAHPSSPRISEPTCKIPFCYGTEERDALVPAVRALLDPALAQGDHVLLLGDMNMTEREPAYAELSYGLHDAWKHVGTGLGFTWGMQEERSWRWPLLRIDYLFSSPKIVPISSHVDCTWRGSDHCIVSGVFALW